MKRVIECILRYHDKLSYDAVYGTSDAARQVSFHQAAAIRELLKRVQGDILLVSETNKGKFQELINGHINAASAGLFWNKKVTFEDE